MYFWSFFPQGSGQSQNESSNQSLCSVGSLSDKELEVSPYSTLTWYFSHCHVFVLYTDSHNFPTDSREKGKWPES